MQMQIMPTSAGQYNLVTPQYRAALDSLVARIASCEENRSLSDDMVLLMPGREGGFRGSQRFLPNWRTGGRWDQKTDHRSDQFAGIRP